MKKCKECGAPLEGFMYSIVGKLCGLKESKKYKGVCNKCEGKVAKKRPSKAKKKKSKKK